MGSEITRKRSPEEVELEGKQDQLSSLEDELAALQEKLSSLEADLQSFNAQYLHRLGVKFLRLDELKHQIAQAFATLSPDDQDAAEQAAEAEERVHETAEEVGEYVRPDFEEKPFAPTEELKSLFREVAKAVHPDLAVDEDDRKRREQLMAEANRAYKELDADRLREIQDAAELSRPIESDEDVGRKLVRVIRLIASVQSRMSGMRAELERAKASSLWELKCAHEDEGDVVFKRIEQQLDSEIAELESTLTSISTSGES